MMLATTTEPRAVGAAELADAIRAGEYAHTPVTVVGYGTMGKQYVAALQTLGVEQIRVVTRSPAALGALRGTPVEPIAGGVEAFAGPARHGELGIVSTPTAMLIPATERLIGLGFRRLLIEKPVALYSQAINRLAARCDQEGVEAAVAYNRLAYPSAIEASARAAREGGVTSCTYGFTELIREDWVARFPADELARWGIANSAHPIGLAHGLIGLPARWAGERGGAMPWHPSGAVFVGSGVSVHGVPFAYHADWGSKSRWWVEIQTREAAYRLCPLERLFEKRSSMADWTEIPVPACHPQVKAGLAEEVAAMLDAGVRQVVKPVTLFHAAALTRFAESVFGYATESTTEN